MATPGKKSDSAMDQQLLACVKGLQSGDSKSLAKYQGHLIELTEKRLFKFLFYLCGNRELAQDLCQEVYLKIFKSISSLDDPARFMSWTFRIGKNLFLDRCDGEGRQSPGFKEDLLQSLENEATEQDVELMLAVRQQLAEFDPEDRLLLMAVDLQGLSYLEAAQLLDITESSVRSRIHRLRLKFIERMEKK